MVDSSELLRRPKEIMWRKSMHSMVPAPLKAFFNTAVFNAIPRPPCGHAETIWKRDGCDFHVQPGVLSVLVSGG